MKKTLGIMCFMLICVFVGHMIDKSIRGFTEAAIPTHVLVELVEYGWGIFAFSLLGGAVAEEFLFRFLPLLIFSFVPFPVITWVLLIGIQVLFGYAHTVDVYGNQVATLAEMSFLIFAGVVYLLGTALIAEQKLIPKSNIASLFLASFLVGIVHWIYNFTIITVTLLR